MPTIKDVAKKAGVSVATVSRVLNDSGYYDPEKATAVRNAVNELGYRRNIHWARLRQNASNTIGFLLGNRDTMNSMQMSLLMACERVLHKAGYDVVFTVFRYNGDDRASRLVLPRMLMQEGMLDGVILAGLHYGNLLDAFARMKMPYVLLGNTFIGEAGEIEHDAVVYDDVAGSYEGAQYLLRQGHRRIAFVGNAQLPWFRRRYDGYLRAMKEAALQENSVVEDWQVSAIEYGQFAAAQLLRQTGQPTAIFAGNDELAAAIWKELTKRRIQIPRDISLLGFGDRSEFSILEPSLTTISVFQEKVGETLAQMLLAKLAKPGLLVPSRVLPCKIVERSSCGLPSSRVIVASNS